MGELGDIAGSSAVTPGRTTHVRFDIDETVLIEPAWSEFRGPRHVKATNGSVGGNSFGVMQLASGWWGLQPINYENFESHEAMTAAASGIMRKADFVTVPHVQEVPKWRKPVDLPGALDGASPRLQDTGDHFNMLLRPAGDTYNLSLVRALPLPPLPPSLQTVNTPPAPPPPAPPPTPVASPIVPAEPHVQLDHVAVAAAPHAPDTGYRLRWSVPGSPHSKPDYPLIFYFGGELTEEGLGMFAVVFTGNGMAILYEREDDLAAQPPLHRWAQRMSWRYANPMTTTNSVHNLTILPHGRRYLQFTAQLTDATPAVTTAGGAHWGSPPTAPTTRLYTMPAAHADKRPKGFDFVTGSGYVRFDVRRDLAVSWQAARLVYRTDAPSGYLVDGAMNVPFGLQGGADSSTSRLLVEFVQAGLAQPNVTPFAMDLFNTQDAQPLPYDDGFIPPGGLNTFVPRVTFQTADPYHSPFLWGYTVTRKPVVQTISPGEFSGGILQHVSVTGAEADPTHESARLMIQDPQGVLPRLALRGLLSVEISTSYDDDPDKKSVLFRGYARSPRRRSLGHEGLQYPQVGVWAGYEIECVGMWRRLQSQLITGFEYYGLDPDAPLVGGMNQPWKVTDVVRAELGAAGFLPEQIDVPDFPMRLWFSPGVDTDTTWMPASGTRRGDYLVRLIADYLGGYLIFDPNAGTSGGMWRLKFQPRYTSPLWNFILTGPDEENKLVHPLTSYPANTSPILRVDGTNSLVTWVEPPEISSVLVMGIGEIFSDKSESKAARAWYVNNKSVDWPAHGTHADPESPDYLGWFEPLIKVDPFLPTKEAAAWTARRESDFAAHGRPLASFTSHLVLVGDDADDKLGDRRRPLRYGDGITIVGQPYLVRCCNPDYSRDHGGDGVQLQYVEAQKWIPLSV